MRGLSLFVAALLLAAPPLAGQVHPDTVRVDTLPRRPRADTIPQRRDTIPVRPDTIPVKPDTVPQGRDTIPPRLGKDTLAGKDTVPAAAAQDTAARADTIFYNLPRVAGSRATGFGPEAWSWDHDQIMASGAVNLAELLRTVPGLVPLLGGDYGTPMAVSAFGLAGGRVRIIRDGFEVIPLEGGVTDLGRVGLGGIDEVRLERRMGELVIEMQSLRYADARTYSLIEAGTGDFNTNLLRGTFAAPRALGGDVAVNVERVDTRGPGGAEPGSNTGTWVRYQLHRGESAGLAVEMRRMKTSTGVTDYASSTARTDWDVRGSARLLPGLTAQAYWGRSTHKIDDARDAYITEGGTVGQTGLGASWEHKGLFANVNWRRLGGSGLPTKRLDLAVGDDLTAVGGFSAGLSRESWPGVAPTARYAHAWTAPLGGILTLFGSWESGSYGARTGPLEDVIPADSAQAAAVAAADTLPPGPRFHLTDRTATRFGAEISWRGVRLAAARLALQADSLLPLGLEMDRDTPPLPGGKRSGWEASATLPIPVLEGLTAQGSYQQWDSAWSYLPKRIYQGALVYHNSFLPTGDLELWTSVGVRGHDPMDVRQLASSGAGSPLLASVPFYQSWYFHLQVRVVTVRAFIDWENFSIRRNLQDFPGRVLPLTRSTYGIRWNLWN